MTEHQIDNLFERRFHVPKRNKHGSLEEQEILYKWHGPSG
jgi:hypothetical protein